MVPLLSIPRNSIAENPFTSLLVVRSSLSSIVNRTERSEIIWGQYLAIELQEFLKGLIGGTLLVLAVHFTNASLGYAYFVRPPNLSPYSADAAIVVKEYGKLILFFIRGILLATSVATMEELLFRSWLPDEISVNLGHHMAMVLSGLAFALFQRSLSSMPALLFLSLALLGAKQRTNGSLYVSIGLRTGISPFTRNYI